MKDIREQFEVLKKRVHVAHEAQLKAARTVVETKGAADSIPLLRAAISDLDAVCKEVDEFLRANMADLMFSDLMHALGAAVGVEIPEMAFHN